MKKFFLLIIILTVPIIVWSEPPCLEIAQKFEQLKEAIQANQGMVLETAGGKLVGTSAQKNFDLQHHSNYRIFLLSNQNLGVIQAQCVLSPNNISRRRSSAPDGTEYGEVECYHWLVMTFSSLNSVTMEIRKMANVNDCEYAIVVASAGRSEWNYVRRMSDGYGNVYEIQDDNSIFRNGRKYISKPRYPLVGLCVSKQGSLFMLTTQGYVLRGSSTFIKNSNRQAIWMVAGNNDLVYILFDDGSVYDRSARRIYYRHNENRAVDLVEDNGTVWLITKEGRRIELKSNVVQCD